MGAVHACFMHACTPGNTWLVGNRRQAHVHTQPQAAVPHTREPSANCSTTCMPKACVNSTHNPYTPTHPLPPPPHFTHTHAHTRTHTHSHTHAHTLTHTCTHAPTHKWQPKRAPASCTHVHAQTHTPATGNAAGALRGPLRCRPLMLTCVCVLYMCVCACVRVYACVRMLPKHGAEPLHTAWAPHGTQGQTQRHPTGVLGSFARR